MSKTEDISKDAKDAKEYQFEEDLEIPTDIVAEVILVSDKKEPEFFECSGNFTIFID